MEDLIFPATLVADDGTVLSGVSGKPSWGHGWSSAALTPYTLVSGTPPQGDGDIVLDIATAGAARLEVGDTTVVQSTSSPKTYRVAGIARPDRAVVQQSALFFSTAEARRLAGHDGSVAAYGIFGVSAGQAKAALAGTSAVVSTGRGRGQVEFIDAANARVKLTSMAGALGGTALIIAAIVVAGTFALSIQQRAREFALLRSIGTTPRQLRRMVSREALVLGLLGAIPGALLGLLAAGVIRAKFVSMGALPDTLQLARSPLPIIAAVIATAGAAWVAAWTSARRPSRIPPVSALAESAVESRTLAAGRIAVGALFTALAAIVTVLLSDLRTEPAALPVTYLTVLLWMVTVALLGPLLVRGAVALLGRLLRRFPVSGFLAAQNVRANSRRLASVITPLALLIGFATTILFVPTTLDGAAHAQASRGHES